MAIPTAYVFTKGTCKKKEFFGILTKSLEDNGWVDVSSNPATDFHVYTSKGNTGDKNLVLQIKETNFNGANPISTTNSPAFSFRGETKYTPGDSGKSGVFDRPNLVWSDMYVAPIDRNNTFAPETDLTYYMYTDANGFMYMLEYPRATLWAPLFGFIRLSDTNYVPEPDSRGLIYGQTAQTAAHNLQIVIWDVPGGISSAGSSYEMTTYSLLVPQDPNADNKSFLSSVYYGSNTEGMRGKIDGVKLVMFNGSNYVTGDTITVGDAVYTVFITHQMGNTSFPSRALALRTA